MTNGSGPLKVLMLASSYPRNREDTASIFLRYLAESLSKRGIRVHVLAPADQKGGACAEGNIIVHRFRYFPARWQKLAYGSGILPNLRRRPWLWAQVPLFLLAMIFSMLRAVRKERPDLIHAHWILPQGMIALLAKWLFKISVISTAHGGDAFAFRCSLPARLKTFVVRKSDAWTSNTQATAAAVGSADSIPKAHIIPMGVDVDAFARSNGVYLRRELPSDELLVLFVGRLVEKKGVGDLLRACSLLPPDLRDRTTLWIVGDGEQRPQLRQYAEDLAIGGKVRFWGQISHRLLADYYAAADLFVAPSVEAAWGDTEGQGAVLIEAFAARLCVLATQVGGIGEVVNDGLTGVLVEPRNPRQIAAAMENLLTDKELRRKLADNAFATVKERYDWQKIAQDLQELYLKVARPPDR